MITSIVALTIPLSSPSPVHAALSSHAPIYIVGNDNFPTANGVVAGSGTIGNPYIIENWEIDASTAHGIWIRNTTVYFIIRNCYVSGNYSKDGIHFDNVTNGKIDNYISRQDNRAIYLWTSENNFIENNTCENNYDGIYLYVSGNNFIKNNTCENNYDGIYLYIGSDKNRIENNIVKNSTYGIYLYASNYNNSLTNNTCENNIYDGIYLYSNSNKNRIENNTVKNSTYGIRVWYTDNNRIENNTCENNSSWGIYLYYSSNIRIENNIVNNSYGIYLNDSYNNNLNNNTCENNIYWGIFLHESDNNRIENNTCENTKYWGIYLDSSDNNLIENNRVENNSSCGIYLSGSSNNRIYHNNIVNNATQTYDSGTNYWDNGYPSGGNYWSDYTGVDDNRGPHQDIPGPDGIGDSPYNISGSSNQDRYPLMNPWPHVTVVVNITISPSYQDGLPGENLDYIVTVANFGNVEDNYDLTVLDDAGWTLKLFDSPLENVPAGENRTTTLRVTVPENAAHCTKDNVIVTAVSQFDNTVSDNANCTAHAVFFSLWISHENGRAIATGTTNQLVKVNVWNKRNVADNFIITATPDNLAWTVSLSDDNLFLNPTENGAVRLTVTPPSLVTGQVAWTGITVTVTSETDPSVSDNLRLLAFAENLAVGWNLIGFPTAQENDTPINFPGNLFSPGEWTYFDASARSYKTPSGILPLNLGLGYWVRAMRSEIISTCDLPVENYTLSFAKGWNLIGFPVTSDNTTPNSFQNYNFNRGEWTYFDASARSYKTPPAGDPLKLGVGYWARAADNTTVTVPL
jgi:parallel beta-helix repeat protein